MPVREYDCVILLTKSNAIFTAWNIYSLHYVRIPQRPPPHSSLITTPYNTVSLMIHLSLVVRVVPLCVRFSGFALPDGCVRLGYWTGP